MKVNRREFLKVSGTCAAAAMIAMKTPAQEYRNGMPYRTLGRTGEKVSLLCIGGAHIGMKHVSEEEGIRIIRTAIDEGVNFLDNAWAYNDGLSEKRMGRALKDGYRDKVFLMTKHKGRDRETAQQHLEDSLRRFDVDVIDLWQFHEIVQPDLPERIYNEGAIEVALKAKEEGKIRYIGFTGHRYPRFLLEMIERGFPWDTVQMPLNVLDYHFRSFEHEVLPIALEKNIGVIAMKTLGGSPAEIPVRSKSASVEECLRYAMSLPVATVCSGIDSMEKLKQNLAVAKNFRPMSDEERSELLARTRLAAETGEFEPYKTKWHG